MTTPTPEVLAAKAAAERAGRAYQMLRSIASYLDAKATRSGAADYEAAAEIAWSRASNARYAEERAYVRWMEIA